MAESMSEQIFSIACALSKADESEKSMLRMICTAQEETAQMTGGDYNRNIKLRVTEAKRKREVDEIGKAQTAGE